MRVTVKLHGALGLLNESPGNQLVELAMPDGATAGDVLGRLADQFGRPFEATGARSGDWLPRGVRMFVEGQLARNRKQPLAAPGVESQKVIVILVSPMMGGAR